MQSDLIEKLMPYNFKLGHNTWKQPKIFVLPKGKSAVNHSTETRWFKKFCSGCKNLDDEARSGRPKTMNSEAILQTIEANTASSTQRFIISQSIQSS